MEDRVGQLLGVVALAVMDRLRAGAMVEGEAEAGTLVHVRAWPGGSVGDLAGVVGLSQPATVRLVDRLVEKDLLRRAEGRDRRTVALVLTEAGSRAADAVLMARAQALTSLLTGLSPHERGTLERLLGQVATTLANDRPGAVRVCRLCDRKVCTSGPGCPLDHTVQPDDRKPVRAVTPR
jgi:DNA-binding MarR family transcriptional regulator